MSDKKSLKETVPVGFTFFLCVENDCHYCSFCPVTLRPSLLSRQIFRQSLRDTARKDRLFKLSKRIVEAVIFSERIEWKAYQF